jgi:hypothetical protein
MRAFLLQESERLAASLSGRASAFIFRLNPPRRDRIDAAADAEVHL